MKKNRISGSCRAKFKPKRMPGIVNVLVYFIFFMMNVLAGYSQETEKIVINAGSLEAALKEIRAKSEYTFFYHPRDVEGIMVERAEVTFSKIEQVLDKVLENTGLEYAVEGKVVIISRKNAKEVKQKRLQGKIIDEKNVPLPGVTVIVNVKGLALGTVSDVQGNYKLALPDNLPDFSLVYSFVGMKTEIVKYTGQDTINVVMQEDVNEMEEVIVTGYQQFKKHEMVGAVERIKADDLFTNGNQSLEQMLQGRIAGMSIVNTSGMVGTRQKVRVRGTSSILGNQEPVWVVDGMIQEDPLPFKTSEFNALGQVSDENMDVIRDFVGGAISWLNPSDIEDITVLKDAAATVMYGVKAANGVIVITTKKGKAGRMSVNFDARMSMTPRVNYKNMELMNSKERVDVSREVIARGLTDGSDLADIGYEGAYKDYVFNRISFDEFNDRVDRLETVNTDWFDILFCNPLSQNYSVGVSGGSERFTYRASLGASLTQGTAKGNDKTGYSGSINISTWLHPDKVKLDARLSGNYAQTDAFYRVSPYTYASSTNRAIPCYNEDGSLFFYAGAKGSSFMYNILHELDNTGNSNVSNTLNGAFALTWNVLKGLKFSSTFGFGTSNVNGETYATEQSYYITSNFRRYEFGAHKPSDIEYKMSQLPHGGELNNTNDRNVNYTWRYQIDYNLVLNEAHRLNFMFSNEIRSSQYKGYSNTVYGYLPGRGKTVMMPPTMVDNGYGEMRSNSLYNTKYKNTITDRKSNTLSFLFNASYSYKERYVFNLSARTDASNKFGENKKSRRLPVWSAGFRWNMAEEGWMKSLKLFNELSFRASYGWQGNVAENFGPDLIAQIPSSSIDPLTGEYLLAIKSLPYPDLRWEKTQTLNLGLDMGFLKNRLMASVNYYLKKTKDLITQQPIPYEFGMLTMPVNQGDMENSGYELTISVVPVRTDDFVWNLSFNTGKNTNKVKSKIDSDYSWRAATQGGLLKEGYAYSSFWAFEMDGLDGQGLPRYVLPEIADAESREDVSNWMKYAGKQEADLTGGLNTSFRYKTLTLSASFNISIGGKKFLAPAFETTKGTPNAYYNLPKELVYRWRAPGDEAITDIPALPHKDIKGFYLPNGEWGDYHAMYNYTIGRVVNASFFRCNSINLAYTLPADLLKSMKLKGVSLNFGVSNPFIIVSKDFKGKDPEVATGSQPISQTYTLGISVSL